MRIQAAIVTIQNRTNLQIAYAAAKQNIIEWMMNVYLKRWRNQENLAHL